MAYFKVLIFIILVFPATTSALAQNTDRIAEINSATIGLRGGYDSNPTDGERARGSAFVTQALNWDYARGSNRDGYGLSLTMQNTTYHPRVIAASLANNLTFTAATPLTEALTLRGVLTASNEQTWSRRQNAALLRTRLEYDQETFRLFGSLEARAGALNERNYFALGSFLPRDENSLTVTTLAGAAYKTTYGEIGVSASAARTRYLEDYDYIGFRRDNDRVQPNLFYAGNVAGATLEGSVSPLNAWFPAKDFDSLRRLLYTAKAKIPLGAFTVALTSSRTTQETTLPFSVIDLVTQHEARLTARFWEKNAVSLFVRQKIDDYYGLSAKATTRSLGLEYARNLDNGFAATAAVTARRVRETGNSIPDAINVMIGLQKQFEFSKAEKKS